MRPGSTSPWTAGRLRGRGRARLLFGAMYEDAAVDDELLDGCSRLFAVGAAGDTAMSLAGRGRHVTAVDVNSAQVGYILERLAGGRRRRGAADRLLAAARLCAPAVGWSRRRVARFLRLADPVVQQRMFDRVLDTRRFRTLMDVGLAPASLLRAYRREFVDFLPDPFGPVVRRRLRAGISTHPNVQNPYAALLFAGVPPPVGQPDPGTVEVHHADAARFLEERGPGTFDGFTLSNVLDGADRRYRLRLAAAVAAAGAPLAPVVLRTLRDGGDSAAARWAARDRSMIWGGIIVTTSAEFPALVRTLS